MWIPPIIERQLRIALRRHRVLRTRFSMAAAGSAAVAVFLLFHWLFGTSVSGNALHTIFLYAGLYLAAIPALRVSVGLFSEERRNQTLELLFLTGIGAGELFFGKLLSGMLIAATDLLAVAPFLAVPFMLGGVSPELFLATLACFPLVLFFVVAVGTLASVCCKEDGVAFGWALVMIAFLNLAIPLPYYFGTIINGTAPFSTKWLCLSPAFGPYMLTVNFTGFRPALFWVNWVVTFVIAFAMLVLAAILLNLNWRQSIVPANGATGWRGVLQECVHGSASWRLALRRRLLPENPFEWLARQDPRPVVWAYSLIGVVVMVWLLGWLAWPQRWTSPMNFYITASILVLGTERIVAYAAARRIAIERRDGSLELLLTTHLQPKEIVEGQLAALRNQFRPVRWTLFALCAMMIAGGLFTRSWTTTALVSYSVIWIFFPIFIFYRFEPGYLRAMWIALNTGRIMYVANPFKQWYWIFWIWNSRGIWTGLVHASGFPSGSIVEVVVICLGGLFLFIFMAAKQFETGEHRGLLLKYMRSIAGKPLPQPDDPRLKYWDPKNPFFSKPEPRPVKEYKFVTKLARWSGKKWVRMRNSIKATR